MSKGTRLVGQLTSDFIKAQNKLTGREGQVIAYVENEPDVPFWRKVFRQFAPGLKVNFKPGVHSDRGKQTLLNMKDQLGKELLLCLDSDYDYLLQHHTADSTEINTNEFIFQTYTYSVENYRCFPENLEHVCVEASHVESELLDFHKFLKAFSKVIYQPLLYSVLCDKKDIGHLSSRKLGKLIGLELKDEVLDDFSEGFRKTETAIQSKIIELEGKISAEELEKSSKQFEKLGLNEENAYLFVNGHAMYDKVAKEIVSFVTKKLRALKIKEFEEHSNSEQELKRKKKEYNNQKVQPDQALKSSYDFWACELMNKIEEDIRNYCKNHHS